MPHPLAMRAMIWLVALASLAMSLGCSRADPQRQREPSLQQLAATRDAQTKIYLTVFLEHDQALGLEQIKAELGKRAFFQSFPPPEVEVLSWYVIMGIGQVVTLRFAPQALREVNVALESRAWGPFRTQFFATYPIELDPASPRKLDVGKLEVAPKDRVRLAILIPQQQERDQQFLRDVLRQTALLEQGVELESWQMLLGKGQLLILRTPPNKVRATHLLLSKAFHDHDLRLQFWTAYNLAPVVASMRDQRKAPPESSKGQGDEPSEPEDPTPSQPPKEERSPAASDAGDATREDAPASKTGESNP